jgi:very-short-patch-repair endonuclease
LGVVFDELNVVRAMRAQVPGSSAEHWIGLLAARQYGVAGRRQLLALGFGRCSIQRRLAQGRLHQVHRGVYAVGHRVLSMQGRWMAAVLAAGPGAALSHRSAAALNAIGSETGEIDVTVPIARRNRRGLCIHVSPLAPDEITEVDGIPVTTVARTILDLAAVWPRHRLERTMHEAELRRLTSPTSLDELLRRHPRRRGNATLRAIMATARLGDQMTRSEFEARFLAFIDDAGLPRPETNVLVERFEVDCAWRTPRLIVELDGHATHSTRRKFESDRARDRALQAAGWRVIRITWRQMKEEAGELATDLRTLLPR